MSDLTQKPQETHRIIAEEALLRLWEGNRRYVADEIIGPNRSKTRQLEVAQGQKPFAVILGCSDSRVPPELIFDCGLGDLFVVRTAGHGVDEAVLGSIHFGVTQLHIPLVVVLGHRRCGAVEAALAAGERGDIPGSAIGRLVELLRPAVAQVGDEAGDRLDAAVRAHVALTVKRLQADPVLAPAIAQGRLRVVGACYDLDGGWVELIAA